MPAPTDALVSASYTYGETPKYLHGEGETDAKSRMPMNKIKNLIREFEKIKDPFQKLVLLGSIQNELEMLKKDLSRKI